MRFEYFDTDFNSSLCIWR